MGAAFSVLSLRDQRDRWDQVRFQSSSGDSGWPYMVRAPRGPTALGRWKIQFCQADRRPKILVSSVSGPAKRKEASMPVSASGEKAARASIAIRTSSSQSMSSGAEKMRPAWRRTFRSEEHTSELQSQSNLVCRLLLEK